MQMHLVIFETIEGDYNLQWNLKLRESFETLCNFPFKGVEKSFSE